MWLKTPGEEVFTYSECHSLILGACHFLFDLYKKRCSLTPIYFTKVALGLNDF